MIETLPGPWLPFAAVVLLAATARRFPTSSTSDRWFVVALTICAAALRSALGLWGPLHINGQGPLWINGALDPRQIAAYGPGYFEVFGWVARLGPAPDVAVFAANLLLSAASAALLYATARLAGVERGGAAVSAAVLAADAVIVRTAASEGYFSSITFFVLAVQAALALYVLAACRADRWGSGLALASAGLFAATAARIHPAAYFPLALCPLIVLGAAQPDGWTPRLLRTLVASAAIAILVLATSGQTIAAVLWSSSSGAPRFSGLLREPVKTFLVLVTLMVALQRWVKPPWLPTIAILSVTLMLVTRFGFFQHPTWTLCYERLFWPGILLGAAPVFAKGVRSLVPALAVAAAIAGIVAFQTLPRLRELTTEQLEYRFLQEVLGQAPLGCAVAAMTRAGNRIWHIPDYLVPRERTAREGGRSVNGPSDLSATTGCLWYVRSSLCTSVEARPRCDAIDRGVPLERVASRTLPAVPSYTTHVYDHPDVEVVVFRVPLRQGGERPNASAVADGAPIPAAVAQALHSQLAPLRESDGCRLTHLDTSQYRFAVEILSLSGRSHTLEFAARSRGARRAGDWEIAAPPALVNECGATLAAIERVLSQTPVRY